MCCSLLVLPFITYIPPHSVTENSLRKTTEMTWRLSVTVQTQLEVSISISIAISISVFRIPLLLSFFFCPLPSSTPPLAPWPHQFPGWTSSGDQTWLQLWSPYVIGQTIYIFILFLLLSFFPRLISAVGDWMFTILRHMVWPQCEFRTQV